MNRLTQQEIETREMLLTGEALVTTYENIRIVRDRAVLAAVEKILAIIERHKQEWIRPSEGAAQLPIGSHACELITAEIRREFPERKGC